MRTVFRALPWASAQAKTSAPVGLPGRVAARCSRTDMLISSVEGSLFGDTPGLEPATRLLPASVQSGCLLLHGEAYSRRHADHGGTTCARCTHGRCSL